MTGAAGSAGTAPRLILHIGAPKTATSSLQHALAELRPALAAEGVAFLPTRPFQKGPVGRIVRREKPSLFGRFKAPTPAGFLAEHGAGAEQVLISDEGCTGFLMYPTRKRSWARMVERAFVLNKFFAGYDYRVVITVRRQDSFLLSCYGHRVEHGRVEASFEDYWRHEIDIDGMSWLRLLEALEARHGRDRLVVLPFEAIRDGFRAYVLRFLQEGCGIDPDRLDGVDIPHQHVNRSLPALGIDVARMVAERLSAAGGSLDQVKAVIRGLDSVLPADRFEPFRPPMDELRAALAERYAAENRIVAERFLRVPHPGFLFD